MSRHMLALLLFAAAASAQALDPARQDANGGGGTCPAAEASEEGEEAAEQAPNRTPGKAAPGSPSKGGSIARPRTGARWHSFLPGMFK